MSVLADKLPLIELPIGEYKRCLGIIEVERGDAKSLLPLVGVQITGTVADRIATINLKQTFRNSFAEHLEAVYIFPLSGGCVVSDFELRVGTRVVKGVVKERQEARRQYQDALDQGKRAALLEQERDDVFTMQVGNVAPNEEVTVLLTYSERLPYFENGKTELRLPLVVAPRFIPGAAVDRGNVGQGTEFDTNIVSDASRITPPRLTPGFDPKTALSINVEILQTDLSGADSVSELSCSQHATQLGLGSGVIKVELSRGDERLNRDFVLSWRLTSKAVKSSLMVFHHSDGAHYGMLSIMPPKRDGFLGLARDVVFVLDRSGSMMGLKMQSAARACSMLLHTLSPSDRFAIQAFDDKVEWMLPRRHSSRIGMFFPADEEWIEKGDQYLREVTARGGTVLDSAINDALSTVKLRSDADVRIPIVVLITDGEVGNEAQILKRIQKDIGDARVFTVGVDTAVNSGLLRRLAGLGGGTATFVSPGTDLERALRSVAREIGEPLITDLEISGSDGVKVDAASMSELPDLFAGRAVTSFFKLSGNGSVRVRGRWSDGRQFDEKVKARSLKLPAIAQLWAKAHITDMEDSFRLTPSDALRQQIVRISEQHSVLTKFTAFIAVDHAEIVNNNGYLHTVVQPVEAPEGWGQASMSMPAVPSSAGGALPRAAASSLMGQLARSQRRARGEAESGNRADEGPSNLNEATGAYAPVNDSLACLGGNLSAPEEPAIEKSKRQLSDAVGGGTGGTGGRMKSLSRENASPMSESPMPAAKEEQSVDAVSSRPAPGAPSEQLSQPSLKKDAAKSAPAPASAPAVADGPALSQSASCHEYGESAPMPSAPAPVSFGSAQTAGKVAHPAGGSAPPVGGSAPPVDGSAPAPSMPPSAPPAPGQAPLSSQPNSNAPLRAPIQDSGKLLHSDSEADELTSSGGCWSATPAASWSPSPAASSPTAPGGGGVFQRIGEFLGGALHQSEKRESIAILQRVNLLKETLERYLQDLRNGSLPDGQALESARQELLEFVSQAECGTELPLLQKFLRSQLKELTQSLKQTGVNAAGLVPLWERHFKAFEEALTETTKQLAGSSSSSDDKGKFWEQSI